LSVRVLLGVRAVALLRGAGLRLFARVFLRGVEVVLAVGIVERSPLLPRRGEVERWVFRCQTLRLAANTCL
jgi:hypothetical protein